MTRRLAFLLALPLLAGVIALVAWPDIEIRIEQPRVAAEIEGRLPVTVERSGVTATVRDADVVFEAAKGVTVKAVIDLRGFGLGGVADVEFSSGIRYDRGNFYLTDVSMDDIRLTLAGSSSDKIAATQGLASSIWQRAREIADERRPGASAALDGMRDATEARAMAAVKEAVENFLRNVPVYSLNDRSWKHAAAAMALKDVHVGDRAAVAVLDVKKAAGTLALLAASILMGVLAGLGWVMAVLRS